jgi:mannose-6-phosphate isomerase
MNDNQRPWGFYENLVEEDNHKIKRITVKPGQRLSLQKHEKRCEHWYLLQGMGLVTLNDETIQVKTGSSVDIFFEDVHRITNTGDEDLVFIEVQTGAYFGEDDIVRLEDDYNRV